MDGEVHHASVIVESLAAAGVSRARLGFGVFLPQPSPHSLAHFSLHFVERPGAIGIVNVFDSSTHPSIEAGDDLIESLTTTAFICFPLLAALSKPSRWCLACIGELSRRVACEIGCR